MNEINLLIEVLKLDSKEERQAYIPNAFGDDQEAAQHFQKLLSIEEELKGRTLDVNSDSLASLEDSDVRVAVENILSEHKAARSALEMTLDSTSQDLRSQRSKADRFLFPIADR